MGIAGGSGGDAVTSLVGLLEILGRIEDEVDEISGKAVEVEGKFKNDEYIIIADELTIPAGVQAKSTREEKSNGARNRPSL